MVYFFYGFLVLVEVLIFGFIGHFWYKAAASPEILSAQWRWTSEDSRDMWIDAAKTMITAAELLQHDRPRIQCRGVSVISRSALIADQEPD